MKFKSGKNRRVTDKERISCGYKPEGIIPEIVKMTPAKMKWPCKRGKGEHRFILVPDSRKKWRMWVEYECSACGKREVRCSSVKESCPICGKRLIPDLEAVTTYDGMWDEHTFKYDCDCFNKDLRLSIG